MPRGDKSSYTEKQKRQARHIEEGYETRGLSRKEAEARAWATVNKETGGAAHGTASSNSATSCGGFDPACCRDRPAAHRCERDDAAAGVLAGGARAQPFPMAQVKELPRPGTTPPQSAF
jgi:hypothetical protein